MIDGFFRAGNRFFDMINASLRNKESWAHVPAEVLDRHGAGLGLRGDGKPFRWGRDASASRNIVVAVLSLAGAGKCGKASITWCIDLVLLAIATSNTSNARLFTSPLPLAPTFYAFFPEQFAWP